MAEKRPNIIFITTDQQNFNTLGINGNKQIKTPNIDALASGGVNFTHAFIQNTVCVPSRACMHTGRYTHQHGVTYMESAVDSTPGLPEWELTFMEHLQKSGYYTGATGKIHMYPEKGFDWHNLTGGKGVRWTMIDDPVIGPAPLGPNYQAFLEKKSSGAYEKLYRERKEQSDFSAIGIHDISLKDDEYVDTWIADESINFIRGRADKEQPFFLQCGFCGPHPPFDPPEPYRSMYAPEDMQLPPEFEGWPSWRDKWDERQVRKSIAYYWAMVTCIDTQIGRIVDALKECGVYDNTLLVFVSDHGDMLGERGMHGKCVLYDTVIHVPLWIVPPAGLNMKPQSISKLVSTFDVAPTILDFAGVDIPETMSACSLKPLMEGTSTHENRPEMIFSEYVSNDKKRWGKCVRTETYKLIRWEPDGHKEFYDLQNDPEEKINLAEQGEKPEKQAELEDLLYSWLARTEWRHNYK
jgi:arylsulfatase